MHRCLPRFLAALPLLLPLLAAPTVASADPVTPAAVVGKWKLRSHTVVFEGQKMDMQAALLQQRPCVAQMVYEIHADGRYVHDLSGTTCDEKYKTTQAKLHGKTRWKLEGSTFTTSATNFAVGQSYTVSLAGNTMTWVGTDGQGTLVFQR